jgi:hypothetical protein
MAVTLFQAIVIMTCVTIVPIIVDIINAFRPNLIGRLPQKLTGYFLVTSITFFLSCSLYYWWNVFFPYHLVVHHLNGSALGELTIAFHYILTSYMFAQTIYHFVATHFVGPGTALELQPEPDPNTPKSGKDFCVPCNRPKLPQSYHCKACNQCAIRFDHHCPFLAKCVGMKNQRHFILFLAFFFFGTIYALYMTVNPFLHCFLNPVTKPFFENLFRGNSAPDVPPKSGTLEVTSQCLAIWDDRLMFIPVFLGFFPVSALLFWQLYVGYTHKTTKEIIHIIREKKTGYDATVALIELMKVGKMENFYFIFGENFLEFLMSPWIVRPNRHEKEIIKAS